MDFELTSEQAQLRDSVRRYLADRYPFDQRNAEVNRGRLDRRRWSEYAELGLLAAGLPEDAGGWGGGAVETALVMEEIGRGLVLEPLLENAVTAAHLLLHAGPERRGDLLEHLASGERVFAVALHEEARDYAGEICQTTARRSGDGFLLSGSKILVSWGGSADWLLVTASLDGAGPGLFLVDPSAAGVAMESYPTLDGRRAADVTFADVVVDDASLLVKPAHLAEALGDAIDQTIVAMCAESVGCMDAVLELTARYLAERKQFGRPLADFQALQHRMADMFTEASFARSMTYQGLSALALDRLPRANAVSAAKIRVDHASHFVGGNAVHNHGGMGFTEEYPAGHYFRRLMAIRQSLGDRAFHLKRYAQTREQIDV